jgi:hypothetical protein
MDREKRMAIEKVEGEQRIGWEKGTKPERKSMARLWARKRNK